MYDFIASVQRTIHNGSYSPLHKAVLIRDRAPYRMDVERAFSREEIASARLP